jgi:hypothetical protein
MVSWKLTMKTRMKSRNHEFMKKTIPLVWKTTPSIGKTTPSIGKTTPLVGKSYGENQGHDLSCYYMGDAGAVLKASAASMKTDRGL